MRWVTENSIIQSRSQSFSISMSLASRSPGEYLSENRSKSDHTFIAGSKLLREDMILSNHTKRCLFALTESVYFMPAHRAVKINILETNLGLGNLPPQGINISNTSRKKFNIHFLINSFYLMHIIRRHRMQ